MTRGEITRLVSRALACIEAIYALTEASYLPERFMTLHHYLKEALATKDTVAFDYAAYYVSLERVDIAFFFGRIAFTLLMALVFWNCGPWIARFLLPERNSAPPAA